MEEGETQRGEREFEEDLPDLLLSAALSHGLAGMFGQAEARVPPPVKPKGRWQEFSTSDFLAARADTIWVAAKEAGNKLLAAKEYEAARREYERGALLAIGPIANGSLDAFLEGVFTATREESPLRRVVQTDDLRSVIFEYAATAWPHTRTLANSLGDEMTAAYPNRGAAICWGNRAAAWLMEGRAEEALADAQRARESDPEYLKGHRRELSALRRLGRKEDAEDVYEGLRAYGELRSTYPTEAMTYFKLGWIDLKRAQLIYGAMRFNICAPLLAKEIGPEGKCEVRASIVPFGECQVLTFSVTYGFPRWNQQTVNAVDWYVVDTKNGELADKPPNGFASEKAMEVVDIRLGIFIAEAESYGLKVVAVCCGQGLTDHVAFLEKRLKAPQEPSHEGQVKLRPLDDAVIFHRASFTSASEIGNVVNQPDPRGFMAMMARRPSSESDDSTRLGSASSGSASSSIRSRD